MSCWKSVLSMLWMTLSIALGSIWLPTQRLFDILPARGHGRPSILTAECAQGTAVELLAEPGNASAEAVWASSVELAAARTGTKLGWSFELPRPEAFAAAKGGQGTSWSSSVEEVGGSVGD